MEINLARLVLVLNCTREIYYENVPYKIVEIWNRLKKPSEDFLNEGSRERTRNEPYKMNLKQAQDSQPTRALLIISLHVKRKASSERPCAMNAVAPIAASKKLN